MTWASEYVLYSLTAGRGSPEWLVSVLTQRQLSVLLFLWTLSKAWTLPSWLFYLAYFLKSHISAYCLTLCVLLGLACFVLLSLYFIVFMCEFRTCFNLNERTNERMNERTNEWMHRVTRRPRNSADAADSTKFLWLVLSTSCENSFENSCYQHRDSDHHQNLVIYCKSHMPYFGNIFALWRGGPEMNVRWWTELSTKDAIRAAGGNEEWKKTVHDSASRRITNG